MPKPFKFRYVKPISGLYVLFCAAAVVAAVVYAGRAQHWFVKTRALTIKLPDSGSLGLKPGAEVKLLGTSVGTVRQVNIDVVEEADAATGKLQVRPKIEAIVLVEERYFKGIRKDSRAVISRTLGIAGDAFIEISLGTGDALDQKDPVITAESDRGTQDMIDKVMNTVDNVVVPTIEQMKKTLEETQLVIKDLRDPTRDLQRSLASLRQILGDIEEGKGLAGRLLKDEAFAAELTELLPKLNDSFDELRVILGDVRSTARELPELTRAATEPMKRLPELIEQTQVTMRRADSVLEELRVAAATLPDTSRKIDQAATLVPGLLVQAQESLRQVQKLAEQVQRSWILGGKTPEKAGLSTVPPENVGAGSPPPGGGK